MASQLFENERNLLKYFDHCFCFLKSRLFLFGNYINKIRMNLIRRIKRKINMKKKCRRSLKHMKKF